MKVIIAHADTCLSDYWSGHHRPYLQISAYRQSFAAVRRALISEIRQGFIGGSDNDARLLSADMVRPEEKKRADALTRAVYAAIRRDVKPAKKRDRLAFRDIEPDAECYAFFVIMVED